MGKALIAIDKLIVIILVALVLVLIIFFIVKGDLLGKFRSLPGFSYNKSDQMKEIGAGDIQEENICKVKIGFVRVEAGIFSATDYIYLQGKRTELLWNDDKKRIELDEFINKVIGSIDSQNKIFINPEWFISSAKVEHPGLPGPEELILIQGAFKIKGGNELCKLK